MDILDNENSLDRRESEQEKIISLLIYKNLNKIEIYEYKINKNII